MLGGTIVASEGVGEGVGRKGASVGMSVEMGAGLGVTGVGVSGMPIESARGTCVMQLNDAANSRMKNTMRRNKSGRCVTVPLEAVPAGTKCGAQVPELPPIRP